MATCVNRFYQRVVRQEIKWVCVTPYEIIHTRCQLNAAVLNVRYFPKALAALRPPQDEWLTTDGNKHRVNQTKPHTAYHRQLLWTAKKRLVQLIIFGSSAPSQTDKQNLASRKILWSDNDWKLAAPEKKAASENQLLAFSLRPSISSTLCKNESIFAFR